MTATPNRAALVVAALAVASGLAGCAYDYLQRTDRVGYSAGNAVKANIAAETTDPAASRNTKGLGKNGIVVPLSTVAATPSP